MAVPPETNEEEEEEAPETVNEEVSLNKGYGQMRARRLCTRKVPTRCI